MKYILFTFFTTYIVNAADLFIHDSSLFLSIIFLIFAIMVFYAFYLHKCKQKDKIIEDQAKKIQKMHAYTNTDEKEKLKKDAQIQQDILSLKHTIETLERQLQEGTKNQVVAKIEALQKKRQSRQNNATDV